MKYSEAVGVNYFDFSIPMTMRKLVYYVDYVANGKSRGEALLHKFKIPFSGKEVIPVGQFFLVGVYIKRRDFERFTECMKELETSAPIFVNGYKEARIDILDQLVVMKE